MCETCGCENTAATRTIDVRQSALALNERLAARNRDFFQRRGMVAINLLSSPGSGKTALLEATARAAAELPPMAAVVGDLQTENDATRLRRAGLHATQINTGEACHLDAHGVAHALEKLPLDGVRLLFIENVGNLVCPAAFDLGEEKRVVLLSVTEGEDKPLKYPAIFSTADLVVIAKMDLAETVGFDRAAAARYIRQSAPEAECIELSVRAGTGMRAWFDWLRRRSA